MSDLVLVFFDARHPEPGAMRDTLKHLVATTIGHRDANKVLYILNQIDTTAKEDNLEEVIGSWQRALSQEGLISGNFYGIYNENSAMPIEDEALHHRLKGKKDTDMTRITDRMDKVSIERAYRIIKALEDFAREIKDKKISLLQEALQSWVRKVLWTDLTTVVILLVGLGALQVNFNLFGSQTGTVVSLTVAILLLLGIHIKARSFFAQREAKKWEEKDPSIAKAVMHNTQWWKPIFGLGRRGWHKETKVKLDMLISQTKRAIQKLNDQFVSPSGTEESSH
jgi:hypothetical protein